MADPELRVEARQGIALVVATMPQPLLRKPKVEAALIDLYAGYADEPPENAKKIGSVNPGGTLTVEYNPDQDRDLRIFSIARAIDGTPDVGQMLDAQSVQLPVDRTAAPVLAQLTNADHTTVTLGAATNRFAKRMKVETAEAADFSGTVVTTEQDLHTPGNVAIPVTRTSPGSTALTVYVRVSISNGGDYGPPSDVFSFTFANLGGTGGTTGGGTYPPGAIVPVSHPD